MYWLKQFQIMRRIIFANISIVAIQLLYVYGWLNVIERGMDPK